MKGRPAFLFDRRACLSRPDLALPKPRRAAEGIGRSGATRSHAQRAVAREHGEDGEHRTFPEVSTVAHFRRSRDRALSFMRDVTKPVPHLPRQGSGAMPARASLPRRPPRRPSCAPAHAATFSLGAVASGAARRGRGRDEILAAARTVRAKSAMARPQTIPAATPSPSRTGRDAAARAGPSPSAYRSGAPRLLAMPCAVLTGIAPASKQKARSPCQRQDGRRVQQAPAGLHGSFSAIEPDPAWHTSQLRGGGHPRWCAHRPAIADMAWQVNDMFC